MNIDRAMQQVLIELRTATEKFGGFASYHEGYAVILEEMDELWCEVKCRQVNRVALRVEVTQIAAMAIRFLVDLIPDDLGGSDVHGSAK